MTIHDLVDRVKSLPKDRAEEQIRTFLMIQIGPDLKGKPLENRFKRKMRKRVKEL